MVEAAASALRTERIALTIGAALPLFLATFTTLLRFINPFEASRLSGLRRAHGHQGRRSLAIRLAFTRWRDVLFPDFRNPAAESFGVLCPWSGSPAHHPHRLGFPALSLAFFRSAAPSAFRRQRGATSARLAFVPWPCRSCSAGSHGDDPRHDLFS